MKTKWMVAVMMFAACVLSSCGGGKKQAQNAEEAVAAMSIDEVMGKAAGLVDQTVTIEGVCSHTCSHGAKKMFLVGSDDSKTLRIEAGELGAFDTKVVNNIVTVKGVIKEERIDEAYLQDWENRLKNQTEEKHGNEEGEGGCDTEKNARGETADTPEGRIADFRAKIAAEKAATGKEYLSFYHVVAESYEINE
ncbi:MAG: hypothetical protein IJE78_11830 [Bacteroidaceae bacterium]|nr:hypothetical protein [Bacteroidaceae bacterium]